MYIQQGFALPVVLFIIAALLVGGYWYKQESFTQTVGTTSAPICADFDLFKSIVLGNIGQTSETAELSYFFTDSKSRWGNYYGGEDDYAMQNPLRIAILATSHAFPATVGNTELERLGDVVAPLLQDNVRKAQNDLDLDPYMASTTPFRKIRDCIAAGESPCSENEKRWYGTSQRWFFTKDSSIYGAELLDQASTHDPSGHFNIELTCGQK